MGVYPTLKKKPPSGFWNL